MSEEAWKRVQERELAVYPDDGWVAGGRQPSVPDYGSFALPPVVKEDGTRDRFKVG